MKNQRQNKNEIERVLRSFKSTFFTVGAFSAIISLLMLAPSLYMLQVYDRVLASRNGVTLLMLTVLIVCAYLFMAGLELIRSFVLVRIGAKFDMRLNRRIYTAAFEQNLKQSGVNAGQALGSV
jgi:ATP-binding cassette subfamily C exporter for protease/lipase